MVIESGEENKKPEGLAATKKNLYVFGVGAGIILSVAWTLRLFVFHHGNAWVLLLVAAYFLITGLFLHALLKPIYKGWTWVAHKIGWFNTRLLLGVIFYLIFAPIGLLMRFFGKDPIVRKVDKTGESYWKVYERVFDAQSYEKEF